MRSPKPRNVNSDDHATFSKWRRGVIILYGCIALGLVATGWASRIGSVGTKGTASAVASTVNPPP
jgi:hypothetical protein